MKIPVFIGVLAAVLSAASLSAQNSRSRGSDGGMFKTETLPKDEAERKILEALKQIGEDQRAGNMIVPEEDGRILRLLTETVGATNVVEIGTSVGYSGIWFCLALRKTGGKLTTFEIDPGRARQARENFARAGVHPSVTLIEGDAHQEVLRFKEPIDVLFLDADKQGYLDYLQKLLPQVRTGGLVIAHNMTEGMADPRFVKAITTDPNLETVFLNMSTSGIGVSVKKR
jgi:predicted O-methyltransferase YrrM